MEKEQIFKKLRFDAAKKSLIVNAPAEYREILQGLTFDETQKGEGIYDFVQIFAKNQAELEQICLENIKAGKYDCLFWACCPKMSGKIKSDIKRETIWAAFGLINLETVTQIAIDETWTGMRGRPADLPHFKKQS